MSPLLIAYTVFGGALCAGMLIDHGLAQDPMAMHEPDYQPTLADLMALLLTTVGIWGTAITFVVSMIARVIG